jgi:MoxR-like ATPase
LVQAVPALQTLAVLRGRDYVSSEDIAYLVTPIFQHRLDLVPGVEDPAEVIQDCLKGPMEALSRATLR